MGREGARHNPTGRPFKRDGATAKKTRVLDLDFLASFGIGAHRNIAREDLVE